MINDANQSTIAKLSLGDFRYVSPSTYIPSPSIVDYETGFIDRYFVSKINDKFIIETSPRDYNSINFSFFNKVIINWQIRGFKENVYNGKILAEYGVGEYNKIQVSRAAKKLPGIQDVLTNYFQFWIGY